LFGCRETLAKEFQIPIPTFNISSGAATHLANFVAESIKGRLVLAKFKESWRAMSRLALASAMPESPPMVKRAIKPKLKINGVVNRMEPPKTVAQGSAFNHFRFS